MENNRKLVSLYTYGVPPGSHVDHLVIAPCVLRIGIYIALARGTASGTAGTSAGQDEGFQFSRPSSQFSSCLLKIDT